MRDIKDSQRTVEVVMAEEDEDKSNPKEKSAEVAVPYAEQSAPGTNPEQVEYLSGINFIGTIAAVCLSFVLIGVDSNIVAVAVPVMTKHFGSIDDVGCYTSIYRLMVGCFQLLFGKLYSIFPTKPIIILSLVVFAAGALLAALAPSSPVFIFGRAVTGFASAGVVSGAFAMIIQSMPLQERSTYAGAGGAIEAAAALSAPVLGGLLTDRMSWRWCFFIELPLIGLAFVAVLLFFSVANKLDRKRENLATKIQLLDLAGTLLIVPALTSLVLALQWGGSRYEWSDWRVVFSIGVFAVAMAAFAYLQYRKQDRATLPPRIVLQRSIIAGVLFSGCNNGALAIVEYYMPIYLQTVREASAARAGILVLPIAGGLIVSVFSAGYLISQIGYYNPFMLLTSIIMPVASGLMTTLTIDADLWKLIIYQLLLGIGAGIGFQGPQVAVQVMLQEQDAQMGIAIIQFAQAIGPAVFVAIAQTIFTSRLVQSLHIHAPGVDMEKLTSPGLVVPKGKGVGELKLGILASYDEALTQTFFLSVALACMTLLGSAGIEWRSVKPERAR